MQIKRQPPPATFPNYSVHLGHNIYAIIDYLDITTVTKYRWFLQQSSHVVYAVRKETRNGKTRYIKMHRELLNAPPDVEVHHINHNSLDNRRCNLIMLSPAQHKALHASGF